MNPNPRHSLSRHSLSGLLSRHDGGDGCATRHLVGLLYGELRSLASRHMVGLECGTLQPTALVHEAYMKLARRDSNWESSGHFLAVASTAMRQLLLDYARMGRSIKRGGARQRESLEDPVAKEAPVPEDLLDLDVALEGLRQLRPELARVFELRYFGGLTVEESAAVLKIDRRTVQRHWRSARAWLATALRHHEE